MVSELSSWMTGGGRTGYAYWRDGDTPSGSLITFTASHLDGQPAIDGCRYCRLIVLLWQYWQEAKDEFVHH